MAVANLDPTLFTPFGVEFYGKVNFLKAGLVFSDRINTVSRKYSHEIQTEEFGHGLDGVLRARAKDVHGILNGIDYDEWHPSRDQFIAARFSSDDLHGKAACKADLQRVFGLPERPDVPLLAVISRLAEQKGIDLIAESLDAILGLDTQFVLLGTGEPALHQAFEAAKARHPSRVGLKLGFDVALSHKIEAGADMFLMPSRYEPCGLNQMYSLAYGTIPIVRATGGLDDTIQPFEPETERRERIQVRGGERRRLVALGPPGRGAVPPARTVASLDRERHGLRLLLESLREGIRGALPRDRSPPPRRALTKRAIGASRHT